MSNLTSKTFNGLKWTGLSAVLTMTMQLTYTSVMANSLEKADFGIMTIAMMVVTFSGFFTNMGIGQAIIQKEKIVASDIRAALTSNLSLGIVSYLVIFLGAPFMAPWFIGEEKIGAALRQERITIFVEVLRVVSLSLLISGFSSVSVNLLRRNMRFKTIALINFVAFMIGYIVIGISMVHMGYGVWSLASSGLSQVTITSVLAYLSVRHSLIPTFLWQHFKPLLAYGSKVTFNTIIEYMSDNVNNFFISPYFGLPALGVYDQGRKLIFLPVHLIIANIHRVIFPTFSRLNTDLQKLKSAYLTVLMLVGLFLIPAAVGMSVAAREIVLTIYSKKWIDSIIILQILCFAIMLRYLVFFASTICDSIARLNAKTYINIFWLVLGVAGFFLLKGFGLPGLAYSVLIGEIVRNLMFMRLMNKFLGVTFKDFYEAFMPGVISALLVSAAIFGVTQLLLHGGVAVKFVVIAQIMVGGLTLGLKTLLFPDRVLKEKMIFLLDKLNLAHIQQPLFKRLYARYISYLNPKPQTA